MSRVPKSRARPPRSSPADALETLARLIEETAHAEGWHRPPRLVRVAETGPDGRRLEIASRALDERDGHPVEALLGFDAPAHWRALGVVAEGAAHPLGEPVGNGAQAGPHRPDDRRRVRVVHLVARDGDSATALRTQGGAPELGNASGAGATPCGRIDDVLRRTLGLPSVAPREPTVVLWALVWLDRLLADRAAALPAQAPLDWTGAALLHPAVALAHGEHLVTGTPSPREVARFGALMGRAHDWAALRAACAHGRWPVAEVPCELAAWMDDGIFSRWVTGAYPHPAELFEAVAALVPAAVAERISAVLADWGVPHHMAGAERGSEAGAG